MATDAERPLVRRYSNVALDTAAAALVTLEGAVNQKVEEMRARCASLEVRCPVEGCRSPELTATVGYVRGDGTEVTAYFSHKAGGGDGGHGPAGYARTRVKHALKEWANTLGFEAALDLSVPEANRTTDMAIDGPAWFAIGISGTDHDEGEWSDHNLDLAAAGLVPTWFWMAPKGSCVNSFDLSRITEHYDNDLHRVWLAGVDTNDEVKLAMACRSPSFSYERNAELVDGPPDRCSPLWRGLADIGLDVNGFVDQALLDMIEERTNEGDPQQRDGRPTPFSDRYHPDPSSKERDLFSTLDEAGDSQPSRWNIWSPEELSVPGTRWMRDMLHDRRHQQFLDGVASELID